MTSKQFKNQLNQFKIELNEDSSEYICNMPDDMIIINYDLTKCVNQSKCFYVVDASINDKVINDFY